MRSEELKPCKHCGGRADIVHQWQDDFLSGKTTHVWWVRCLICGTKTRDCKTKEEALKDWYERKYEWHPRRQAYGTAIIGLYRIIAGFLWRTWIRWKH